VTVLLEKDEGQPKVHRMRMIHLAESDFNFIIRLLWGREFMRHNEQTNGIHKNQHGGRKGWQGQSAALKKKLTIDVARHYKEPMVIIDKDATACYDRIVTHLVILTLIKMGMPTTHGKFMKNFLSEAEYKVKTAKDISKGFYKCKHGSGQGLGWSPPNWCSISDVISRATEAHCLGMAMEDPGKLEVSQRNFDAFVDDVNAGLSKLGWEQFLGSKWVPIGESLLQQAEPNVQFYSDLLEASGGALNLQKSYFYLLEIIWDKGKWRYKNNKNVINPMIIKQSKGTSTLEALNPNEPRKILGVTMAPDGSMKGQIHHLQCKTKQWGTLLSKNYLSVHDVHGVFRWPPSISGISGRREHDVSKPMPKSDGTCPPPFLEKTRNKKHHVERLYPCFSQIWRTRIQGSIHYVRYSKTATLSGASKERR